MLFNNWYTEHLILYPIQLTAADVEIRSFYINRLCSDGGINGWVYVMKGWKISLTSLRDTISQIHTHHPVRYTPVVSAE